MMDMLGQLRDMQKKLEETREALAHETVEASTGRGAVRVVMSGTQECQEIHLSPELIGEADVDRIEKLVLLAVNQAIQDSQVMAARRLGPITGPLAGLVNKKK